MSSLHIGYFYCPVAIGEGLLGFYSWTSEGEAGNQSYTWVGTGSGKRGSFRIKEFL